MAKVTKQPTGLSVSRDGSTFTFSWKIADADYDAGARVAVSNRKKVLVNGPVSGKSTSYKRSIPLNTPFKGVSFSVRGQRKKDSNGNTYTISPWTYKTWDIFPPAYPSVSCSLSSEAENRSTFSWSISDNKTWMSIYTGYEYQSVLIKNYASNDPPKTWDGLSKYSKVYTGTSTSGSWTKNEDYVPNMKESYTRWFRVRSNGPAGTRGWKYAKHVYALPPVATDVRASLSKKANAVGYICTATWQADAKPYKPIDITTVEYLATTPETHSSVVNGTRKVTWNCPETTGWEEAASLKDTAGWDTTVFQVDQNLDTDEALYVRIKTKHDSHVLTSSEVRATGALGVLPPASNISIVPNASTHKVQISASNDSAVVDSFIAVYYRTASNHANPKCIGILPKGESSITINCPDWGTDTPSFGLRTLLADYSPVQPLENVVTEYSISNIKMNAKEIQWADNVVPKAPDAQAVPFNSNTIRVTWDWPWLEANQAEITWADHEDSWSSTDQPNSYVVDDLNAAEWNISGLAVGTWYVRVRLLKVTGDTVAYGLWSEIQPVKLASAPAIPALMLNNQTVAPDGEVVCYWAYVSNDGTSQMSANICEAIFDDTLGAYIYGEPFAKAETAQHLSFLVADQGWQSGETHYLAVRVTSASGEQSQDWSTPVPVKVADPITCSITSTDLVEKVINPGEYVQTSDTEILGELTSDTEVISGKKYYTRSGEEGAYIYTEVSNPVSVDLPNYYELQKTYYTRSGEEGSYVYTVVINPSDTNLPTYYESAETTITSLIEMPLHVTVYGAGLGSTTTLIIERSKSFHMDRPDESDMDGFEGETVFIQEFDNDGAFTILQDDLIGYLDDGAAYRIVAIAKDSFGQIAEDSKEFEVHWRHQAIIPEGTVRIDTDYDAAILTPLLPSGAIAEPGDVCDIYRLSVDKPELIYQGATFGSQYVDPYPTIGKYGGYRFVYRTFNGDYTTEDNTIAWYDSNEDSSNDILDTFAMIINYDGVERVRLVYNMSLNNKWSKDFQKTAYLGGHIQGDWNPAVNRTGSVSSLGIVADEYGTDEDRAVIEAVRRLAMYPGVCHVRTPDGSSFAANIDVSENREEKMISKLAKYQLDITRIDSESLDGLTYEEWLDQLEEE